MRTVVSLVGSLLLIPGCGGAPVVEPGADSAVRFDTGGGAVDSGDSAPEPAAPLAVVGCVGNVSYTTPLPVSVAPPDLPVLIGWHSDTWRMQMEARGLDAPVAEVASTYALNTEMQPLVDCLWLNLPPAGDVPGWSGYAVETWEAWSTRP